MHKFELRYYNRLSICYRCGHSQMYAEAFNRPCIDPDAIFSGDNSEQFWREVGNLSALTTGEEVRQVIYMMGCMLQKLETRLMEIKCTKL